MERVAISESLTLLSNSEWSSKIRVIRRERTMVDIYRNSESVLTRVLDGAWYWSRELWIGYLDLESVRFGGRMQTRVCAALGWFDDDINRTAAISLGATWRGKGITVFQIYKCWPNAATYNIKLVPILIDPIRVQNQWTITSNRQSKKRKTNQPIESWLAHEWIVVSSVH